MHAYEARRDSRGQIYDATLRLVAEFSHDLPAGSIIACVWRSRESLLQAGVRDGLAVAAEAMARSHLASVAPAHG